MKFIKFCSRFVIICTVVKTFPVCANAIGMSALFCIHSGICFVMCIIAILILPDTQGKTLTELSKMYSDKPKNQDVLTNIVINGCDKSIIRK